MPAQIPSCKSQWSLLKSHTWLLQCGIFGGGVWTFRKWGFWWETNKAWHGNPISGCPPNSNLIHPSFPLTKSVTVIFVVITSKMEKICRAREIIRLAGHFPRWFLWEIMLIYLTGKDSSLSPPSWGCSGPWRWQIPPRSRRRQKGSGKAPSAGRWWPGLQTSRWEPAGAGPRRSSTGMPCQWRGKGSSAPPHPFPGGVLIQTPDPTGLQRISPANVSVWETFPEPLSQGKQGEVFHTHATQTGGTTSQRCSHA